MSPPTYVKNFALFLVQLVPIIGTFSSWFTCSYYINGLVQFMLPIHQHSFDALKVLLVADSLMRYADHNFPFHILFLDSYDYQLGFIFIMQNVNRAVAYYSRKLSSAQKIIQTLLSMLETFIIGSYSSIMFTLIIVI